MAHTHTRIKYSIFTILCLDLLLKSLVILAVTVLTLSMQCNTISTDQMLTLSKEDSRDSLSFSLPSPVGPVLSPFSVTTTDVAAAPI